MCIPAGPSINKRQGVYRCVCVWLHRYYYIAIKWGRIPLKEPCERHRLVYHSLVMTNHILSTTSLMSIDDPTNVLTSLCLVCCGTSRTSIKRKPLRGNHMWQIVIQLKPFVRLGLTRKSGYTARSPPESAGIACIAKNSKRRRPASFGAKVFTVPLARGGELWCNAAGS